MANARTFLAAAGRTLRRLWLGACWLFAPVATSVKGALDRNDFRPVIARVIVLGGAAGAGVEAALRDPEVMGAAAVLLIAVLSGLLEAISRANQGDSSGPAAAEAVAPAPSPQAGGSPPNAERHP